MKIWRPTQKYVPKAQEDPMPAGIIHRKKMKFPTPPQRSLQDPRTTLIKLFLAGNREASRAGALVGGVSQ